jgi:hypothetical protein
MSRESNSEVDVCIEMGIISEFAEKYYGITEGFSFRIGSVERETRGQVGKRVNIIN